MIDTISLTIQQKDFKVLDHKRFTPSSKGLFDPPYYELNNGAFTKCIYNPSPSDFIQYGYLPRLTLIKAVRSGGFVIFLKVEFSAPKLLYGNNFDELVESDFGEVCWKLKEKLLQMGIQLENVNLLADAQISTIHYSKNIVLTDYTTPYAVLKEVSRINMNKSLDMSRTDFRNEGHAVKCHSNDFEFILYDKLKDLQQAKVSDKRAEENDNNIQLGLFDTIEVKKPFEVLRMEVRLGSRRKIKEVLGKIEVDEKNLTFKRLFSSSVSQKVLMLILNKIEAAYPKVLTVDTQTHEDFVVQLMMDNPELTFNGVLQSLGATVLIKELGVRGFRKLMDKFNGTNWYRLNNKMKQIKVSGPLNPFDLLTKSIQKFEPVELVKYKESL